MQWVGACHNDLEASLPGNHTVVRHSCQTFNHAMVMPMMLHIYTHCCSCTTMKVTVLSTVEQLFTTTFVMLWKLIELYPWKLLELCILCSPMYKESLCFSHAHLKSLWAEALYSNSCSNCSFSFNFRWVCMLTNISTAILQSLVQLFELPPSVRFGRVGIWTLIVSLTITKTCLLLAFRFTVYVS